MDKYLIQRTMGKWQREGGEACYRRAQGSGISYVFTEEVAFGKNLERWAQLHEAECMCGFLCLLVKCDGRNFRQGKEQRESSKSVFRKL